MIILEKPYVSDFLIKTIKENNFKVLDNEIARKYFSIDELTPDISFIDEYKKRGLIYSNSENSIGWVENNMADFDVLKMIKLSKDKFQFRKILKEIFPDYYFKKIELEKLKNFDIAKIKFPVVLKPCVGFLSFGVYPVRNEIEWHKTIEKLNNDIEKLKDIFPKNVVDMSEFLVEEMVEGREFALDAYFDKNGNAVILNIFEHPFFDDKDVSDRVYYTSKEIIKEYLEPFTKLLNKIGKVGKYSNFPFHLELRANEKAIIPIELNPMRFCGWCITDIAKYAWGINVYEAFLKGLKPDWNDILSNAKDGCFYFTIGDIPACIDKNKIKEINYKKYLKNIKNPLDIRKTDYKNNPIFAIVFAYSPNIEEIKNILKLNMKEYIV